MKLYINQTDLLCITYIYKNFILKVQVLKDTFNAKPTKRAQMTLRFRLEYPT